MHILTMRFLGAANPSSLNVTVAEVLFPTEKSLFMSGTFINRALSRLLKSGYPNDMDIRPPGLRCCRILIIIYRWVLFLVHSHREFLFTTKRK